MRGVTVALFAALGALAGCDTLYGVNRLARLESLPSLECIAKVVSSTRGVGSVERSVYSGGTAVTLSGLKEPASTAYNLIYRKAANGPIVGVLQVFADHDGTVVFSQSLQGINVRPPQREIDFARPMMKNIEEGVEAQCDVAQLPSKIREHCLGVQCPSIEPAAGAQ